MKKVFVIAEAGVNHNGSVILAKEMVDIAVAAGCDAVKFQTFKSENVVTKHTAMATYQKENLGTAQTQLEMIKELELSYSDFIELKNYCAEKKILFLSTPFDLDSIDFLAFLDMPILKVPSGEITNLPYLKKINSYGKRVILSTGMSDLDEIQVAINTLTSCEISLLHCTTEYPCPYEEVNLNALKTMKKKFNLMVGYSDHTEGIEISVAAVAMGASIIEKHFTLDKNMPGPDHKASLEPDELKALVKAIRNVEAALGDGIKIPTPSESKNKNIARKSIVAKRYIKKGEIFTEENLTTKRPGNGLSPMQWDKVIGSVAQKDYVEDEML